MEMEAYWFIILVSLSMAALLKALINLLNPKKLPPGPLTIPIISTILWLFKSVPEIELILRSLHAKLGPVVTLHLGPRISIFVSDRALAHRILVQNGSLFSDRPRARLVNRITSSNQHNINSAAYGPTWRLLRRNLTAEILHPSRVKSYSHARSWVLEILMDRLKSEAQLGTPVRVMDHFRYAMFCLLVLMCFGDKLNEDQIKEIQDVELRLLFNVNRFQKLNFWPSVTKIVLRKRWQQFLKLQQEKEAVLVPLIRAQKKAKEEGLVRDVLSYVETLFDLELPEEKRKLNEGEMVSLCSEFLGAGTDTTATALLWVMANLVKYPHIQEKLFMEIKGVVGDGEVEVKEEELQMMPYLKAVILEGLRRHPPVHFVIPHRVTEDVVIDNYVIPKNASINFMVAEMGLDPKVWEDPMGFRPERFMSSSGDGEIVFDITGSKEIKMMPFGVGRRICPGIGLAMLHLEYFVANLVWNYEWKAKEGDDVDLSEKQEFTIVMKNPLQAYISPRSK